MFKVDKENQNKFPCQGKNSFTYDKLFLCKRVAVYCLFYSCSSNMESCWKS